MNLLRASKIGNGLNYPSEELREEEEGSAASSRVASSDGHDDDEEDHEVEEDAADSKLAKRETKAVTGLRMCVFIVLTASTLLVSGLVYYYISSSERRQFEQQFFEDSNKVLQSMGTSLDLTLGGLDALVVGLVSYARASNQTWPYVSIPDFGVRAEKIRSLTNAVYLNLYMNVPLEDRAKWEAYSAENGRLWVEESLEMQVREGMFQDTIEELNATNVTYWDVIHDYDEWDKEEPGLVGLDPSDPGPFLPMWQTAPLIPVDPPYNWDLMSVPLNQSLFAVFETHKISITEAYLIAFEDDLATIEENQAEADWISSYVTTGEEPMEPISDIYYPIIADAADKITVIGDDYNVVEHKLGGFLSASIYWRDMMKGILPQGSNGIRVVVENPCNPVFTYQINGPSVEFLGVKDAHEDKYNYLGQHSLLVNLDEYSIRRGETYSGIPVNEDFCPFTVRVYPSSVMEGNFTTRNPILYTILVVCVFAFTSAVFLLYDWCVERRQKVVMKSATRTSAIVSSFFPSNVRDRIIDAHEEQDKKREQDSNKNKAFLTESHITRQEEDLPIADYFEETTILFADLAGFTSWSSTREPAQVFKLLETLYGCFDNVARRRGVFKVETIGDCYVAVTGLPKPRKNHAVMMALFAADCRQGLNERTQELELTLGPGTGDLNLRVGLHSGGVTGGVLRGDKARFQLFGDTMNTASRMESNGKPGRIQCSQKTAFLLIEAGKDDWLTKRENLVEAKGKGKMQTYWVEPVRGTFSKVSKDEWVSDFNISNKGSALNILDKSQRLVDWNVTVFEEFLLNLVSSRISAGAPSGEDVIIAVLGANQNLTPRDEVVDAIRLPGGQLDLGTSETTGAELAPVVVEQLRSYISVISHSYRGNAFTDFDHASHTCMFAKKLLQRINSAKRTMKRRKNFFESFALMLDPLTQVAILWAMLVHDVDYRCSNELLNREEPTLAARYNNKSVAEQNSFDVAWGLLMEDSYSELRACLFVTQEELQRFRQIGINAIMATDLTDAELRMTREMRWELAFAESVPSPDSEGSNAKALVVLEHLIQAADWWHTVQDWSIYQKWSRRLFEEHYAAYLSGRIVSDPSLTWYETEMAFFDKEIIPLARKLQQSYVFGPSSNELLDFANTNRLEWENRGREIVDEMREALEYSPPSSSAVDGTSDGVVARVPQHKQEPHRNYPLPELERLTEGPEQRLLHVDGLRDDAAASMVQVEV